VGEFANYFVCDAISYVKAYSPSPAKSPLLVREMTIAVSGKNVILLAD
jgi:hypothetical protein